MTSNFARIQALETCEKVEELQNVMYQEQVKGLLDPQSESLSASTHTTQTNHK